MREREKKRDFFLYFRETFDTLRWLIVRKRAVFFFFKRDDHLVRMYKEREFIRLIADYFGEKKELEENEDEFT